MSTSPAISWALAQPVSNPATKLVLVNIAWHAEQGDSVSVETVARQCKLTALEVGLKLRQLDRLGLLSASGLLPSDPNRRPHIPERVRAAVYERDGHRCVSCDATNPLTLDHIYPFSKGGSDAIENLQTMCLPCNVRKGARV